MKVIITKDYEEMSAKAFEIMKETVTNQPNAVLGLATGSTPLGLYANMIEDHKTNGTSYKNIKTVNLDEYVGLDAESDQSYVYFMRENLFRHIDIDLANTNIENGKAADPEAECARYTALLQRFPTDIVCMGIGENGHIAFNDPWVADLDDPKVVKVVELDAMCRQQQVNDGCFATIGDVPTHAMTLTVPTLCAADYHFCMVPAPTKANAVKKTLNDAISADCPATVLRRLDKAVLYLDSDSAALI